MLQLEFGASFRWVRQDDVVFFCYSSPDSPIEMLFSVIVKILRVGLII